MNMQERLNNFGWMNEQYHNKNRSLQDIADELGTNRQRIRRALIRLNIPRKDKRAAQQAALNSGRAEHPTEGKPRPEHVKTKIAEGVHREWANADEATLRQRSERAREQWSKKTPEERQQLLKMAQDAVRVAAKEGSKLERFLRDGLTKAGYDVRYHVTGIVPNANLEVDLLLPAQSVAIEIDGPSHFLPIWGDENLSKNIRADLQKTGLLLGQDLVVIRVKQLSNNVSRLIQNKLLTSVCEALDKVKEKFPEKHNRLIEIEI